MCKMEKYCIKIKFKRRGPLMNLKLTEIAVQLYKSSARYFFINYLKLIVYTTVYSQQTSDSLQLTQWY